MMAFYFFKGTAAISVMGEFVQLAKTALIVLQGKEVLNIILIKPSKYDEQGFVIRDRFGVLPGNTLATLYSLICQSGDSLGANVQIVMRVYDETVHKVRTGLISWICQRFQAKSLVVLAGVQTNQFPRATDLALVFQKKGIQTMVGGFHISGVMAMFPQNGEVVNTQAFEELGLKKLIDHGVSLFAGEAENGRMLVVLQQFLAGQLKPVYNYLDSPPDLTAEPFPRPIPGMAELFVIPGHGTIEPCRGCPFHCSFCAVCNVQGRKMRARSVQGFVETLKANWREGIRTYFITADDTARDPLWPERSRALENLRREGITPSFVCQTDAASHKIPGFLDSLAGFCSQVFVGFETVNPANLESVGKKHNQLAEYRKLIEACRFLGISVQGSYIIGLPNDTPGLLASDMQTIMGLGQELAFFFSFIPIPGSQDHQRMFCEGRWMDPDLNRYDGFSGSVMEHPRMSAEEWNTAYQKAWETFYSVENLVRILKRTEKKRYWGVFANIIWCKYAVDVIQRHPMVTGLFRVRDRKSRREGFPRLSWPRFQLFKFRENYQTFKRLVKLIFDLTEVWLQTRQRSPMEEKLAAQAAKIQPGKWLTLKLAELKAIYQSAGEKAPNRWKLYFQRFTQCTTRSDIHEYWAAVRKNLSRGKLWVLLSRKSIKAMIADSILVAQFLFSIVRRIS